MNIPLVENLQRRRHFCPIGVLLLFASCYTNTLALPAAGLCLAFHDLKLLNLIGGGLRL